MTAWRTSCRVDGCDRPPHRGRAWCLQHLKAIERGCAVETWDLHGSWKQRMKVLGGHYEPFNGPVYFPRAAARTTK